IGPSGTGSVGPTPLSRCGKFHTGRWQEPRRLALPLAQGSRASAQKSCGEQKSNGVSLGERNRRNYRKDAEKTPPVGKGGRRKAESDGRVGTASACRIPPFAFRPSLPAASFRRLFCSFGGFCPCLAVDRKGKR